jgi:DnaJ-domain-containing protein 1
VTVIKKAIRKLLSVLVTVFNWAMGRRGRVSAAHRRRPTPHAVSLTVTAPAGQVRQMPPDDALHFGRPRVLGVPAVAMRLQKRAAAALFARLEVWYVPAPLVERLLQFDVVYALRDFFRFIGLEYDVLTTPDHIDHESQRRRLDEIAGILFAAEQACVGTPFHSGPVADAVSESIEQSEALLERLEKAGCVWRWIDEAGVRWPVYVEFRTAASEALSSWETVADTDLENIFSIAVEYERLKARSGLAESRIREMTPRFTEASRSESERALADEILSRSQEVVLKMEQGELRPEPGVAVLEELLQDLSDLWASDSEAPYASTTPEETRRRYLEVLGLKEDADEAEIKHAWRTLAKRYHSDRNPNNPEAEARMRAINEAYNGLIRMRVGMSSV